MEQQKQKGYITILFFPSPFQGPTQPKSLFALQQRISVPCDYLAALEHSKGSGYERRKTTVLHFMYSPNNVRSLNGAQSRFFVHELPVTV